MAAPVTSKWTKLSIWLGNGASPEVFASNVCGLTTKGLAWTAQTTDQTIPDCTTPDNAVWVARTIRSLSQQISGSGLMDLSAWTTWRTWMALANTKNCKIVLDASTPGYFIGGFVLTQLELSAALNNGYVEVNVQMQSDGSVAWSTGTVTG